MRVTEIEQCCPRLFGTRFAHGARELYVLELVGAVVKNAMGIDQLEMASPRECKRNAIRAHGMSLSRLSDVVAKGNSPRLILARSVQTPQGN
jgi:hypothetical protein